MNVDDRRVVFYIGGFPPIGGIQTFTRDLMVELAPAFPSRELIYWGKRSDELPLIQEIVASGGRTTRSPLRHGCRWNLPDYLLYWRAGGCLERADVLIFKQLPPTPILSNLHRRASQQKRRVPFVLITPYRPAEYWRGMKDHSFLRFFDAIVVQSEAGIMDLRSLNYPGKVFNIPYLPPPAEPLIDFPPTDHPQPIILGFLGRFEKQKNVAYLLECFKRLTEIDTSGVYRLQLFGDGSEKDDLVLSANFLGLDGCNFRGAISRDKVNAAIDSCHLFVNTSWTEGQCLVALEVLSRGRPFVATPVGAVPEVILDSGLGRLIPLVDAAAAAHALSEIARKIRHRKITPQAVYRTFQKKFDRGAVTDRYTSMLRDVMSG